MSGLLLNIVGDAVLLKLLNRAVKERFQSNRPFITVVIEQDGNASVHSNMDVPSERVRLLQLTVASLQGARR